MATRTPWSSAKRACSFQKGITFSSHCHFSRSRKSGGQGVGDQLGNLASSESPGQPEKSITVFTPSFSARRIVLRLVSRDFSRNAWFGCSELPWRERALI